jgi:hypothetical protein
MVVSMGCGILRFMSRHEGRGRWLYRGALLEREVGGARWRELDRGVDGRLSERSTGLDQLEESVDEGASGVRHLSGHGAEKPFIVASMAWRGVA